MPVAIVESSARACSADAVGAVRLAVLDALGYRARFTHFPLAGLCPVCVSEDD